MATISQFIRHSGAFPSEANQHKLWHCDNQISVGAIIEGLGRYETWTDMPSCSDGIKRFGDQIEATGRHWDQLTNTDLVMLVCVLSSLEFAATYYVMTWLQYRANTQQSPSEKLANVAQEMQFSEDKTEQLAGQRMWKRISTLVKITSAQGVLADAVYQKIMVD